MKIGDDPRKCGMRPAPLKTFTAPRITSYRMRSSLERAYARAESKADKDRIRHLLNGQLSHRRGATRSRSGAATGTRVTRSTSETRERTMTAADRSGMTETEIAAIDMVYEAAKEARILAEKNLVLADRLLAVASSLHDLAHEPNLRSVS